MSGYLLNGGLGWNYRQWGPACSSVRAIEMIDAQGESLVADADRHADLYWAARGAGPGFFGVATRFHLDLQPLPAAMMRSTLACSIDSTDALAAWLDRVVPLDPSVELICSASEGEWTVQAVAFAGNTAEARRALAPLESVPANLTTTRKRLYQSVDVETVFGRSGVRFVKGPRYAGDTLWSNASPRQLMSAVRERLPSARSNGTVTFDWLSRAGAAPLPDMAFSMDASTYVHAHTSWGDAAADAAMIAWTADTMTALDPLNAGYYVGETDLTVASRAPRCYSPTAWSRIAQLKQRHDPDNRFHNPLQQGLT